MTYLAISNLEVRYGNVMALQNISIEAAKGEIIAVIGPNGAGKSTLLLAIAGVVRPRQGDIRLAGESTLGFQPERLVSAGIALVPEGRRIFGSLSVAQNLELGATVRRDRAEIRRDIENVLEMFPVLQERFHQRAGKLSGGEQQMLAIGRAMLSRPKLLLLDEPSLGLAPLIVAQVYAAILRLRETGVTTVIVEQSVKRALSAADRSYILNSGTIVMSGKSSDLRDAEGFDAAYFGYSREAGAP
jgi:branched-chain amino acid transport system ATP-binding protein